MHAGDLTARRDHQLPIDLRRGHLRIDGGGRLRLRAQIPLRRIPRGTIEIIAQRRRGHRHRHGRRNEVRRLTAAQIEKVRPRRREYEI